MNHDPAQEREVERFLRSIVPRPAPPGLREKVLVRARGERQARAWTTPLLRACLAACGALLVLALVTDAFLSRQQTRRIQALLDGTGTSQIDFGREGADLAAELGGFLDPKQLALIRDWASRSKEMPQSLNSDLGPEFSKEVF